MKKPIERPLKEKVSLTLDYNIIIDLKELAANDDRSFSQYVNMILKEYLSRLGEHQAHTNK